MYLNILKKDLKRKKAMNIILLVFIILATMFVSSSVNNIISVTTALDHYFEMANVPDYIAATMNKAVAGNLDETLNGVESIDSFRTEEILYMAQANVLYAGKPLNATSNTQILQSDADMSVNLRRKRSKGRWKEAVSEGGKHSSDHRKNSAISR
jgi:putative ABC transport system permease protein